MMQTDLWPPPVANEKAGAPHQEPGLQVTPPPTAKYTDHAPPRKWARPTADEARELRIEELREIVINTVTDSLTRLLAWDELRAEIRTRSPERVRCMEAERGLG